MCNHAHLGYVVVLSMPMFPAPRFSLRQHLPDCLLLQNWPALPSCPDAACPFNSSTRMLVLSACYRPASRSQRSQNHPTTLPAPPITLLRARDGFNAASSTSSYGRLCRPAPTATPRIQDSFPTASHTPHRTLPPAFHLPRTPKAALRSRHALPSPLLSPPPSSPPAAPTSFPASWPAPPPRRTPSRH